MTTHRPPTTPRKKDDIHTPPNDSRNAGSTHQVAGVTALPIIKGQSGPIVGGVHETHRQRRHRLAATSAASDHSGTPGDSAVEYDDDSYVTEAQRWFVRLLKGHKGPYELDEVVSRETAALMAKVTEVRAQYPTPLPYVAGRCASRRAVLEARRKERVERCEGTKIELGVLARDEGNPCAEPVLLKGHSVTSLYSPTTHSEHGARLVIDTLPDDAPGSLVAPPRSPEAIVLDGEEAQGRREVFWSAVARVCSVAEARALRLLYVEELSVIDAAARAGVARETLGRQRDRALDKVKAAINPPV